MPIRRHSKAKILIPMASMGDIAFLLIIFFMLVSDFMKNKTELTKATSEDIDQTQQAQINVNLDEHGDLWLQGQPIEVGALEGTLETYVTERRRDTVVHVTIDKELPMKDVKPVMKGIAASGVRVIFVGEKGRS